MEENKTEKKVRGLPFFVQTPYNLCFIHPLKEFVKIDITTFSQVIFFLLDSFSIDYLPD